MSKTAEMDTDTGYGLYEVGFLIISTVPEEKARENLSLITDILEKNGSTVKTSEGPTLRGLAYPMSKRSQGAISHFDTAYFGSVVFEAATPAISAIQAEVDKLPDLLRFMVIKTETEALMPRERKVTGKIEPEKFRPTEKKTETPLSEEELDKTIEELVVE